MRWNKGVRLVLGGDDKGSSRVSAWKVVVGAALLAAGLLALVSAPGFVSDRDSTVPMHQRQEARQ